MKRNDFIYEITIFHLKELVVSKIITKKEFELINNELIERYKPIIIEDVLDF